MTVSPWVAPLIGQVVGGYRLAEYRDGGNFGMVFEVVNVDLGSRFAMKVLAPTNNAEAAVEFEAEGVLLRKLNKCSSVIAWIESGEETISVDLNGAQVPLAFKYHVMALASGVLEELITDPASRDSIPWSERISHWRGAVKGVHQMHLNTVAHRDLKSSNCLVMASGGTTEVRLTDLGRSKDFSLPATLESINYLGGRGDLRFAPPEFLWFQGGCGESDFRTADLYGLGSLFAELATGHPMTALALGSWQEVRADGQADFLAGRQRDLAVLRPLYRRAIDELVDELPRAIRHDTRVLLRQLCDPVPNARLPRQMGRPRRGSDRSLEWLLRRADILGRQLVVQRRRSSYKSTKNANRSAS